MLMVDEFTDVLVCFVFCFILDCPLSDSLQTKQV